MVFNNCNAGGMDFAFPDVCITPGVAAGAPAPLPYPNISNRVTAIPNCPTILTSFMPTHNIMTTTPMTNGDNAGVNTGVASGTVMGPDRNILGSTALFTKCMPTTRAFMDPTIQNNTNMVGTTILPGQFKVITLR